MSYALNINKVRRTLVSGVLGSYGDRDAAQCVVSRACMTACTNVLSMFTVRPLPL